MTDINEGKMLDIAQEYEPALLSDETEIAAATNTIQKLSARHIQIMEFILFNPKMKLGDVAKRFGVTQNWLSVIINSDLFKAELRTRIETMRAMNDVRMATELSEVAFGGLKKMKELLDHEDCDPKTVKEFTGTALEALGYIGKSAMPSGGGNVNVNVGIRNEVTQNDWDEAQAIIRARRSSH